nr:hypothetical protein KitaXyl93_71640 [Kitasatospora sp. Xyl93]
MRSGDDTRTVVPAFGPGTSAGVLPTRALVRETGRAQRLLTAGRWYPAPADAEAASAVLARLSAPLPTRRGGNALTRAEDRDRRLQRILRTTLHHLDAGAVSPPTVALLAGVARALLPWHAYPNPPGAAPAPRYGTAAPQLSDAGAAPTDAGEALLPALTALFTTLATTTCPAGVLPSAPPVPSWRVRYAGRFRHYGKPAAGVRTATTAACPGCGETDGPWTVGCDWRSITLGCPCGVVTDDHGLAFSEVWLRLPDVEVAVGGPHGSVADRAQGAVDDPQPFHARLRT